MAKHHPDLIMCRKQPGIAIGRLCEKCDGKCVICDSYVRPCTLVRVCDECNYGSFQGRCVICGGVGISDAYYCKECTQQEKDRDGCPKIVNLGSAKTDLFYERKKYGFKKRWSFDCFNITSYLLDLDVIFNSICGKSFCICFHKSWMTDNGFLDCYVRSFNHLGWVGVNVRLLITWTIVCSLMNLNMCSGVITGLHFSLSWTFYRESYSMLNILCMRNSIWDRVSFEPRTYTHFEQISQPDETWEL